MPSGRVFPGLLRRFTPGSRLWAVVLCASACTRDTAGQSFTAVHCIEYGGDDACRTSVTGRPYCNRCQPAAEYQGCSATRPELVVCRPDPPEPGLETTDETVGEDPSEGTDVTSTGLASSSESSAFRCEGEPRALADDCLAIDDARPFCEDGVCLGCGELAAPAFCASVDARTPACDPGSGHCVACDEVDDGCGLAAPVCNRTTGACSACTQHADCPASACHLDPDDPRHGGCFAPERVFVVDGAATSCPGVGTEASPHCTIDEALAKITDDGEEAVLRLRGGGTAYVVNAVLTHAAAIALVGIDGPVLTGTQAGAVLRIEAGFAYVSGVAFADHMLGSGLECDGATVWMQDSAARGNADYGVYTTAPCVMVVERSAIHRNTGGGLRQFGGSLRLHNSAIGLNGNGMRGPGLNLQLTTVDVRYATIVANTAAGVADNVTCLDATGVARNSLVLGTTNNSVQAACSSIAWSSNVVDGLGFAGPGGSVFQQPYNAAWFQNPAGGDFRLGAPGLTPFFGGVALWEIGDPTHDIDGTPRPMGGARGFVGIDEP